MSNLFGTLPDGRPVTLHALRHGNLQASFLDYGARLQSLLLPDAHGNIADVTTGYPTLDLYLADKTFAGAAIGRFANRIARGSFLLDGNTIQLPLNDKTNTLHGGPEGFDRRLWHTTQIPSGLEFTLTSPAGDQGFPGALTVTIRYTLDASGLTLDYTATTDAPTVINLTNHAFFNLAGESSGDILNHHLTIPAAYFTPVSEALVPTGELRPVGNTIFDLRNGIRVGDHIDADDEQIRFAHGWDHNFILGANSGEDGEMKLAAILRDPISGRTMTVSTTQPAIQFYSGNFVDGTLPNRAGGFYQRRCGLCLETQHYPDSPNHSSFPTTTLRPSQTFRSTTLFSFGTS